MHNLTLALAGAWKVLAAGLILGAGLPALFAAGIRSVASAAPARRLTGYGCFALVLLGVVLGVTFIVASGLGKELTFEHAVPAIVDKE